MTLELFIPVVGQILVAIITGFCLIKVAQLKSHINSRMDDLLRLTTDASFAKGKLQGEADQKEKASIFAKGKADRSFVHKKQSKSKVS
jgi:hypothetical protein